jgi:hypothetical protein
VDSPANTQEEIMTFTRLALSFFVLSFLGCGILDSDIENLNSSTPSITSVSYENQSLKVQGSHLSSVKRVSLKNAAGSKALGFVSKTDTEIELKAIESSVFSLISPVSLFIETASGSVTVALDIQFQDGSVSVSKLEAGDANSVLITDGSQTVKWSSSLSGLTLAPVATSLTGSLASIDGNVLTGSSTQFSTEVQAGDSILIGGSPFKVNTVTSDTELITEETLSAFSKTASPVRVAKSFLFDSRTSDSTGISKTITLPEHGANYRGIVVFGFAKAGSLPVLTFTVNASAMNIEQFTSIGNTALYVADAVGADGMAAGVDTAAITMSSSVSARLSMIVYVITGTSSSSASGKSSTGIAKTVFSASNDIAAGGLMLAAIVSPDEMEIGENIGRPFDVPYSLISRGGSDFSFLVMQSRPDSFGYAVRSQFNVLTMGGGTYATVRATYIGDTSAPLQRLRGSR